MSSEVVVVILACMIIAGAIMSGSRSAELRSQIAFLEEELKKSKARVDNLTSSRGDYERSLMYRYRQSHERCHEREEELQKKLAHYQNECSSLARRLEYASKGEQILRAIEILRDKGPSS